MRSHSKLWFLIGWTLAACGGRQVLDVDDAGSPTSGAGGATGGSGGSGGFAGSSSTGGSGGQGGVDAGPDGRARFDAGSAGRAGFDAGSGGSAGVDAGGGSAGGGGTSSTGGSSGAGGAGGSIPPPAEDAGTGGPACAPIVATVGAAGWIAFDSDRDNFRRNLYRMHADRSDLTQLTTGSNDDRQPSFSRDGTQLSYTSNVGGRSQIFVMDIATRRSRQLTNHPDGADESSFSRDGQWIAFHSGASVHVIRSDGTEGRLVGTGVDANWNAFTRPEFSADGTELLYDRGNGIDAVKLTGGERRYLMGPTTAGVQAPSVSPDGAVVAYQGQCFFEGAVWSIWTTYFGMAAELCAGRRVSPPSDGRDAHKPVWVTSAAIAYERVDKVSNRATLALISLAAGSTPCILTPEQEDSRNPTWFSP